MRIARLQWLCARGQIIVGRERLPSILVCVLGESLSRIIHQLVGWDKETAIWWAGACELAFHFDYMLFWVRSPFLPAHHGLTHAGPTLRE